MCSMCSVLKQKVAGYVYEDVFSEILVKKCLPVLEYGLDCVHLGISSFSAVNKCWNTAFRWLFGLGKYESTQEF
jgi:hypothetical protein